MTRVCSVEDESARWRIIRCLGAAARPWARRGPVPDRGISEVYVPLTWRAEVVYGARLHATRLLGKPSVHDDHEIYDLYVKNFATTRRPKRLKNRDERRKTAKNRAAYRLPPPVSRARARRAPTRAEPTTRRSYSSYSTGYSCALFLFTVLNRCTVYGVRSR